MTISTMVISSDSDVFDGWNVYEIWKSLHREFNGGAPCHGIYRLPRRKQPDEYTKRLHFFTRVSCEMTPTDLRDTIVFKYVNTMATPDLSAIVIRHKEIRDHYKTRLNNILDIFEQELKHTLTRHTLDQLFINGTLLSTYRKRVLSMESLIILDTIIGGLFDFLDTDPNAKLLWWPTKGIVRAYARYFSFDQQRATTIFNNLAKE